MNDIVERIEDALGRDTFWDTDAPPLLNDAVAEIKRLREAIRRLAEQDATLSVCDGSVTVTLDATLTDEEREAVEWFAEVRKPLLLEMFKKFDDPKFWEVPKKKRSAN